jgi:hypothetical protein
MKQLVLRTVVSNRYFASRRIIQELSELFGQLPMTFYAVDCTLAPGCIFFFFFWSVARQIPDNLLSHRLGGVGFN